MDTQELTLETIIGPRPIKAPAGWEFDMTAIVAWHRLLVLTKDERQPRMTLRDKRNLQCQITLLANVLANAIGMAAPYWSQAARDLA